MLSQGSLLKSYEIRSVIGRGGFGIVYKGRHQELKVDVAIKEYFPQDLSVRQNGEILPSKPEFEASFEDGLVRFLSEAQQLEKFRDCPNIVTCRDLFRDNGTAYIVMEYVSGLPLSVLLEKRESRGVPLTEQELLELLRPLLKGLKEVHGSGICHRDIKPSNILVRRADAAPILIDFGAAKHEISRHTKSFAPYTDGYAALEQVGEGEIGPWTGIYGLGAVMWRIVAGGNPPFSPPNPLNSQKRAFELMYGRTDPLPSAKQIGKDRFSHRILETIDDCLIIKLNDRVQNCSELLERLNKTSSITEQISASPPVKPEKEEERPEVVISDRTVPDYSQEQSSPTIRRSSLIGGVIAAGVSTIVQVIGNASGAIDLVNPQPTVDTVLGLLECMIMLGGGLIAVRHYASENKLTLKARKGVKIGALSGIFYALAGMLMYWILESINVLPSTEDYLYDLDSWELSAIVAFALLAGVVLGLTGGAIGAAVFKRGE